MSDTATTRPTTPARFVAFWHITDPHTPVATLFESAANDLVNVARRARVTIVGRPRYSIRPAAEIPGAGNGYPYVVAMQAQAVPAPRVAEAKGSAAADKQAARAARKAAHRTEVRRRQRAEAAIVAANAAANREEAAATRPQRVAGVADDLAAAAVDLAAVVEADAPTVVDLPPVAVDVEQRDPELVDQTAPMTAAELAAAVAAINAHHPNVMPDVSRTATRRATLAAASKRRPKALAAAG